MKLDGQFDETCNRGGRPRKYATKAARDQAYYLRQKERAKHFRTQFTGQQEWYTPPAYLEAARQMLGGNARHVNVPDGAGKLRQAQACAHEPGISLVGGRSDRAS